MKKPDATTLITPDNYREKIWPQEVQSLLFVGPATRQRLNSRNIFTIGELALAAPSVLRAALGKSGEMLWAFANGLDNAPVLSTAEFPQLKSVGNSVTTPCDLLTDEDVQTVLLLLSESVAERLRGHGLIGDTVCLSIRDTALNTVQFQHKLPVSTALCSEIYACAGQLFRANYRWNLPVRSVGVSVCALINRPQQQQLTFFPDIPRTRREQLESAVYALRKRYGHLAVCRASLMNDACRGLDPHGEIGVFPAARLPRESTPL